MISRAALLLAWTFGILLPPGGTGRLSAAFPTYADCETARQAYERRWGIWALPTTFSATTICRSDGR